MEEDGEDKKKSKIGSFSNHPFSSDLCSSSSICVHLCKNLISESGSFYFELSSAPAIWAAAGDGLK
jgi:hypothetical protein